MNGKAKKQSGFDVAAELLRNPLRVRDLRTGEYKLLSEIKERTRFCERCELHIPISEWRRGNCDGWWR